MKYDLQKLEELFRKEDIDHSLMYSFTLLSASIEVSLCEDDGLSCMKFSRDRISIDYDYDDFDIPIDPDFFLKILNLVKECEVKE